jgi:VanZ family protein
MYQRKSKLFYENASLITLIICLFYAGVDELHQMLIPGRSAELLDWLADGAGAFLGILVVKFLINRFKYRSNFEDLGKV